VPIEGEQVVYGFNNDMPVGTTVAKRRHTCSSNF
jgi:hypothetical protein